MTHPVTALWATSGRPDPNWQGKSRKPVAAPAPRPGVCALTGEHGPVWPLPKVSTTLTTLNRFPHRDRDPAGMALGPAAAWAIRHRAAMQRPHAVVDGTYAEVSPAGLYQALVALPADPTAVVTVPQSGQKHVLPWAVWGCVGVDDEWLPWGPGDVDRLGTYRGLRQLGFGEAALTEPAPRWAVLARLGRDGQAWALRRWDDLASWRRHGAYLDVAARATRKEKPCG